MDSSCQKECKFIVGRDDIISQLPDDLLHYILSFVDIFDVLELSVLSKRWKNLWTTMPFLDFDIQRFQEARNLKGYVFIEEFGKFINWVLIYQGQSSLTRFRLCYEEAFYHEQVMRWIRIAARRNVQELDIKCDPSQPFELPYSLANSQCLRVLRLNLSGSALQLPRNANFRQLKSLELECVDLTNEGFMQNLFSRCSLLENFSLKDCILHLQVLCIASTSLKYLTIKCFPENEIDWDGFCGGQLDISCPNLFYFSYEAPSLKRFTLGDLSSLEIMCLDLSSKSEVFKILKEVVNIKSLWLKTDTVAEGLVFQIDKLKCLKTTFQRLKSVTFSIGIEARYTQSMFLLLKNCPCLEFLTIVLEELDSYDENWHWQLDDEGSNLWRYNVKSVQLVNFADEVHEMNLVKFILENGVVLEKFHIIWMDGHARSNDTEKLVLRMRKASPVAVRFLESSSIDVGRHFEASSILASRSW